MSCHILARAVKHAFADAQLTVVDGFYHPTFSHSWFNTTCLYQALILTFATMVR